MFEKMYQQYLNDKNGEQLEVFPCGFFTYLKVANELWVNDIYVNPESRREGFGKKFINQLQSIAKKLDCKYLIGRIDISHKDHQQALMFHVGVGAKVIKSENNQIWTCLEVKYE
jgi:GNAT superfamily N-acetyltransferase